MAHRERLIGSAKQLNLPLAAILLLAGGIRLLTIGEYGLSEDEVLKALATRDYLQGSFTANPSHPALSKLFVTLSVIILGETEFALRLPVSRSVARTPEDLVYRCQCHRRR